MQLPTFLVNSLGWLAYEFARVQPFLPTYAHLIASAVFPIYTGAHSALSRPSSAAKSKKSDAKDGEHPEEEEDEPLRMEGLSPTDALLFPLLAGTTLAGLYFLIKWLQDPAILNKILNWYFATFSVFSVSRLVSDGLDVLHSLAFPHAHVDRGILFHNNPRSRLGIAADTTNSETRGIPLPAIFSRLPLPQFAVNILWTLYVAPVRKLQFKAFARGMGSVNFGLGVHGIEGLLVGLTSVLYYNFVSKPWWLTNLMGFGFAYGALQMMSPTTFWTGTLILSGLFFYDIYFVFFTPMMVTVAKSLDIPIKLLFPRPPEPDADPASRAMSMLGLGDVVLPGIMIGLALRFDLYMFYLRKQKKASQTTGKGLQDSSPVETAPGGSIARDNGIPLSPSDDASIRLSAPTSDASSTIIKAPYTSVAEGWGDRLWTSSLLSQSETPYTPRGVFPKPYFHASLVGYIAGMLVTLGAMQISAHPQPALLYLVPGVLTSLWGTALIRGEFQEMWAFSDAAEEEHHEKDGETANENAKGDTKNESASTAGFTFGSFFRSKRSDERSKRLEGAVSKHVTKKEQEAGEEEDPDSGARPADDGAGNKTRGATFLSFSIAGPPPLFPDEKSNGSAGETEVLSKKSGDQPSEAQGTPIPHSAKAGRRNSSSSSGKNREHVEKRQRLG